MTPTIFFTKNSNMGWVSNKAEFNANSESVEKKIAKRYYRNVIGIKE
jgi:hypothetical protein